MKRFLIIFAVALAFVAYAADELTLSESTTYSRSGNAFTIPAETVKEDVTGYGVVQNVQLIPSNTFAALDMASVTNAGYFRVKNLSTNAAAHVGVTNSGAFVPFFLLQPGQSARGFLGPVAPHAQSISNIAALSYLITDK